MLIDHINKVLLYWFIMNGNQEIYTVFNVRIETILDIQTICIIIGKFAYPIFAFFYSRRLLLYLGQEEIFNKNFYVCYTV